MHQAQPPLGRARRGPPPLRIGHNLLRRLATRKDDALRFLSHPDVEFTNNLAERDLRMMKLRQKISGGFRSASGAASFAVIRTLLGTARKRGWNILDSLLRAPHQLEADLATA